MFVPFVALVTALSFNLTSNVEDYDVRGSDVLETLTYEFYIDNGLQDALWDCTLSYGTTNVTSYLQFQYSYTNPTSLNIYWYDMPINYRLVVVAYQDSNLLFSTEDTPINLLIEVGESSHRTLYALRGPNSNSIVVSVYFQYIDQTLYDVWDNVDTSIQQGYQNAFEEGRNVGYGEGYSVGYSEGYSSDSTIASISTAIMQVGVLPINLFLAFFNYEILGINIAGLVGGALTVACLVIALRTIIGTNKGD